MTTIRVKVTDEHIANGRRSSPTHCPLALAIKEVVSGDVRVAGNGVLIGDQWIYMGLTWIDFIGRYDTQHPRKVEPWEFDLDVLT